MKIERISDNQIRCTLNKEDLEGKETLLSELALVLRRQRVCSGN